MLYTFHPSVWIGCFGFLNELQQQEKITRLGLMLPILGLEITLPCKREKQGYSPHSSLLSAVTFFCTSLHCEAFQSLYSLSQLPGVVSHVRVGYSLFARIYILPWQGKVCFCNCFPFVSSCIDCFDFAHNLGLLWVPVGRAVVIMRNRSRLGPQPIILLLHLQQNLKQNAQDDFCLLSKSPGG